jgi:hypothetical protein
MPLKPPRFPPKDQRDWDQWARNVDVIPDDGSTGTAQLADNSVTNIKLADMPALSVKARSANSSGDPIDLPASANGAYLQRNGDIIKFDELQASDVLKHAMAIHAFRPRSQSALSAESVTQFMPAIRSFIPRHQQHSAVDEVQVIIASRIFGSR